MEVCWLFGLEVGFAGFVSVLWVWSGSMINVLNSNLPYPGGTGIKQVCITIKYKTVSTFISNII